MNKWLGLAFVGTDLATAVFLTFFDETRQAWWQYLAAWPVNSIVSFFWPVYLPVWYFATA
ncbi:MAG TPA: hypothetical protein VLA16_04695 [Ideonella sp.]|nr:hypothetical protein [Ideonella sp.]